VVTCNTDNSESRRNCFVGFQNELSGRVAAELLAKFTGNRGKFIVEIGFTYILAHMQRLKGFTDNINEAYPDIEVIQIIESKKMTPSRWKNPLRAEYLPEYNRMPCGRFWYQRGGKCR
jgi:LacI family transcriptional regulator